MTKDYVEARFFLLSVEHGAPAPGIVDANNPIQYVTDQQFDAASHDENLFVKHLTGKDSSEAYEIFKSFQAQLKMPGLQSLDETGFRQGFFNG